MSALPASPLTTATQGTMPQPEKDLKSPSSTRLEDGFPYHDSRAMTRSPSLISAAYSCFPLAVEQDRLLLAERPPSGYGHPHLPPKGVIGRLTCAFQTERALPFWGGPLPAVCEPGGCLPRWEQPHTYMTRVTLSPAFADGVPACACCPDRITSSSPFSLSEASQHHIRHLACHP